MPSTNVVWATPNISNALSDTVESEFELDAGRLYDIGYESDPALVEFSQSIGKSPGCVLEMAKRVVDQVEPDLSRCRGESDSNSFDDLVLLPGTYESVCRMQQGQEICRRMKVADHPYERYSDDELRSLALSSPEASIILARRLEDDAASERYYERAVALSGRPGPLAEWMLQRNLGGLVRHDGVLDIDKAALGYEIYLTTSRLGYGADAVAEFERVLSEEGVDVRAIQKKAADRFQRITDLRSSLVSDAWRR